MKEHMEMIELQHGLPSEEEIGTQIEREVNAQLGQAEYKLKVSLFLVSCTILQHQPSFRLLESKTYYPQIKGKNLTY